MVSRRRVLRQMVTVSAIGGLAGCTGNGDGGTEGDGGGDGDSQSTPTSTPTDTATPTPTATPTATPEPCQDATFVVVRAVTVDASTVDLVIQNRYQDGGRSEGVELDSVVVIRDDGQRFVNDFGGYGGPGIEKESSFSVKIRIDAGPDSISQVEVRYADLQDVTNEGNEAYTTETACINTN